MKKLLSMFLAVALCCNMLALPASAQETAARPTPPPATGESAQGEEKPEEEPAAEESTGETAQWEAGSVPITSANFPDAIFRSYVADSFDLNHDGMLSDVEISKITYIFAYNKGIQTVKGVEKFYNLEYLSIWGNALGTLDVSQNTKLENLDCSGNRLTSLNLEMNTALTILDCGNNLLTQLDVRELTLLKILSCNQNQLTSLDVSKNTKLEALWCYQNSLGSLNVTKNTALEYLSCWDNRLTSINVTRNHALMSFDCNDNELAALDVSANTALETLTCYDNELVVLDVTKNTKLKSLDCHDNNLREIDVSKNRNLNGLWCYQNKLYYLDVQSNPNLEYLACWDNLLTSMNVRSNPKLTHLSCQYNYLTAVPARPSGVSSYNWTTAPQYTGVPKVYFTVRFESNGGSKVADRDVQARSKVSKPASPTRSGCTFVGWYKDAALTVPYNFNDQVLGNMTLYARWRLPTPAITGISRSGSALMVQWSSVTGATTYKLQRSVDGGSWNTVVTQSGTSYTANNIYTGHRYQYRVTAYSEVGNSNASSVKEYYYLKTPAITALQNNAANITVRWDAVTGTQNYYVYRRVPGGSWARVGTVATTSFVDTTAKPGVTYQYFLRAGVGNSFSEYCPAKTVVRLTQAQLGTMSMSVTAAGACVKVTWAKVEGATGYNIYRIKDNGKKQYITTVSRGALVYDDKDTGVGHVYVYSVKAIGPNSSAGAESATKTFRVLSTPKIATIASTSGGIKMTWGSVYKATSYLIYRRVPGGSWARVGTATATTFTDSTAKKGVAYQYCMRAAAGNVCSAYSAVKNATRK